MADCFDDIDWICQENERVRQEINDYFDLGRKNKFLKSQILALMHNSSSFRSAIVTAYKTMPKTAYDFSVDPAGEYAWLAASREYACKYPLSIPEVSLDTIDDVLTVTKTICERFKALIENNGLSKLLYNNDGSSKHESAAKLLFYGIMDSYCESNGIDLTKEGNNGRGPVDFKLSRCSRDKVVVETKLTSNSQLRHGVEIQLPIYISRKRQNRQFI